MSCTLPGGRDEAGKLTDRLVHRRGAHRSAVPGTRSGARRRRQRHLRAGRPDRVAYASARSDADRYFRRGRAQRWGGPIEEIRPGDIVWFPPGEKHWHGASATTAMTHIAIQETLNGKVVDWMEKVSDEQYRE